MSWASLTKINLTFRYLVLLNLTWPPSFSQVWPTQVISVFSIGNWMKLKSVILHHIKSNDINGSLIWPDGQTWPILHVYL